MEDRVFVKQDEAAKEIKGILIPDPSQAKPPAGIVTRIGPGKAKGAQVPIGYMFNGLFHQSLEGMVVAEDDRVVPVYERSLKVGDHILFAAHAGIPVEVMGEEMLVMRISDIICLV